jgi:hypothetical protein
VAIVPFQFCDNDRYLVSTYTRHDFTPCFTKRTT